MKVLLETERLILRSFTAEDAENLFQLDSDPKVMRFINGGKPTEYNTIKEQVLPKFLGYYQKYDRFGFWATVEKSNNEFIGWFHFYPAVENQFAVELQIVNSNEIALGYRLCQSTWGKGYATEASIALINKGFLEWDVQRVVAWALTVNKASTRVMEKVGLKLEKEFVFTESQLPNLQPSERIIAFYGLNKNQVL
ncbi:GNAT family N-acetyltransferase [Scytonema sp. UIC 10036]|uniref:GNAT family N-acetyltransferase n=1 Tax=Scytonema sp. UIC 10036 TaxID=2304196 RepID=UPI0012DA8275|nr:GNAT family N-acetyltransferase [Scytonema sp. UIC 10036]MUG99860.1 GNAT family N-acetyltransferase [Scytonema sp. UIC 10036]